MDALPCRRTPTPGFPAPLVPGPVTQLLHETAAGLQRTTASICERTGFADAAGLTAVRGAEADERSSS